MLNLETFLQLLCHASQESLSSECWVTLVKLWLAKIVASITITYYPMLGSSKDRPTIALVITFVQCSSEESPHVPSRYSDLRFAFFAGLLESFDR
jgi:hypothetical protein